MNPDEVSKSSVRMSASFGSFLLTGKDCSASVGTTTPPSDVWSVPVSSYWSNERTEYISKYVQSRIATSTTVKGEVWIFWPCKVEKMTLPARYIFVSHGYFQRTGTEYDSDHVMWYNLYMFPTTMRRVDAIIFA